MTEDIVTRLRKFSDKAIMLCEVSPLLLEDAALEIERLRKSYRCYSCKQVFEEDDGYGLARQHFGSHLNGDQPKCHEILNGGASWGGGPHDPYIRVRKDIYDAKEEEITELTARCARYEARAEADADQL